MGRRACSGSGQTQSPRSVPRGSSERAPCHGGPGWRRHHGATRSHGARFQGGAAPRDLALRALTGRSVFSLGLLGLFKAVTSLRFTEAICPSHETCAWQWPDTQR